MQSTSKYDILLMKKLEAELALTVRGHFAGFFSSHDYMNDTKDVVSRNVKSFSDLEHTYYGRGLYLILTDYPIGNNACKFVIDGLRVIYRGHCYTVKKRLMSHLINDHYRSNLPEKGVRYDECMKLDDKNGINILDVPYRNYHWRVIVHKMRSSSKMIREQAELSFDDVFMRPICSQEK